MLKTLEEPPPFAHLVLLTDKPGNVLPTIASRCQLVRFDAPTPARARRAPADRARRRAAHAPTPARAWRSATPRARWRWPSATGPALRDAAEEYARAALHGDAADAPLDRAAGPGASPRRRGRQRRGGAHRGRTPSCCPTARPGALKREGETAGKRAHRRAVAATLDHGLQLAALWLRDVAVVKDGAPELVLHVDRADEVRADAERATRRPGGCATPSAWSRRRATMLIRQPDRGARAGGLASRLERTARCLADGVGRREHEHQGAEHHPVDHEDRRAGGASGSAAARRSTRSRR